MTIETKIQNKVATLWLNRPELHNAINPELMHDVIGFFQEIENDESIRIVVIRGKGKSFCAGADLNWMKASVNLNEEDNLEECRLLSTFFETIYRSSKVVISLVQGNVFGGGVGICAASDLCYSVNTTRFSLSETKLGLVAASISTYLLHKMHVSVLKELVFTARHFDGIEAKAFGLVEQTFKQLVDAELHVAKICRQILQNGPNSVRYAKSQFNDLVNHKPLDLPRILAEVRITDEAKEGFNAFLEKRKPNWT